MLQTPWATRLTEACNQLQQELVLHCDIIMIRHIKKEFTRLDACLTTYHSQLVSCHGGTAFAIDEHLQIIVQSKHQKGHGYKKRVVNANIFNLIVCPVCERFLLLVLSANAKLFTKKVSHDW